MMAPLKRCALYTRKSSEEGLQQDFNSLDAQREACAAYVTSQAGEGWRALPALYDDGGFSGGTMERPALQRLLADIKMGKVDVVVVYKIDRLTRALADFARIVELFDQHSVSFVSVTQSFNTTSSMGRLTLNVLLSFAQFEREVTGERIRDKIAASKAKGMWMGGVPPLGYDLPIAESRALVVNPDEAETVRTIFATYLEIGSVHSLATRLQQMGIRSKQWITSKGSLRGGKPFSRGALFHLLRNRTYLGLTVHGDKAHPGMHPPILDTQTFEAVQTRLNANTRRRREQTDHKTRSTLTGRIFDADGHPMSPTMARNRHGKIYRYYVSAPLQQGRQQDEDDGTPRRVSAQAIEQRLSELINRLRISKKPNNLDPLLRVDVHQQTLHILLPVKHLPAIRPRLLEHEHVEIDPVDPSLFRLTIPARWCKRGGRTVVLEATEGTNLPDPVLVSALRAAHAMVQTDQAGLPRVEIGPASPYRRKLIRLAFLSPDLQRAILAGSQPASLTLAKLMAGKISLSWTEQERRFGKTNSGKIG